MPTAQALDHDAAYRVLQARDARFDGRLFVGVTSTGIYCRPVCRVRAPKSVNCRFFANAASAERDGFRPCLRCRPELAPGLSMADSSHALADHAAWLLGQAAQEGQALTLPDLAARLGVTDRHLRRIFLQRHGVAPLAYLVTQRLLQAKQLLTDTSLPVTEVALAAGFGSLRRFNAAFLSHYRISPGALRQGRSDASASNEPAALRLAWRPPYDVSGSLGFLARRALPGVEQVQGHTLQRTLALPWRGQWLKGWIQATWLPDRHEIALQLSPSLSPATGLLRARARQAFDLDAQPDLIDDTLGDLAGGQPPGVRLIGGLDPFEIAVRVIIGQQVTVAAARTLTQRLVERFGEPLATPIDGLNRLFPSAACIAAATPESIGTLGIVRQRVAALRALAQALDDGSLNLHRGAALAPTLQALQALPGIGPWSAQLIALRALGWPDAWPASDIGLLQAMAPLTGGVRDAPAAERHAQRWQPWRSYAVMRLWQTLEAQP